MALVGIELETLVSEPDALTTRPPPYMFAVGLQLSQSLFSTSYLCSQQIAMSVF